MKKTLVKNILGIMVVVLLSCPLATQAVTIESDSFDFTVTDSQRHDDAYIDFATDGYGYINNKIGDFSFSADDLAIVSDPSYHIVSMTLTFTLFDGDTADGNCDYNDLYLVLGNSAGDALEFDSVYLNDFPNMEEAANTFTYDLRSDVTTAQALADLLADITYFYIYDTDGGGNFLYFDTSWTYSLTIDLEKNPVPEPATFLMLSLGLVGMLTFKRKWVTRDS